MRRQTRPEGIRITRVGFWFVVLSVVVAIAATNTGNNALYLVLAAMLALLVVSGVTSRSNLHKVEVEVDLPDEIFANRPFHARVKLQNRSRWVPRWLIVCSLTHGRSQFFLPFLAPERHARGSIDLMLPRRGASRLSWAHLWSVFPLGFFRKGLRYRLDRDLLVYPELFPEATPVSRRVARLGHETSDRKGWGHELHSLREFRPGDDPRSIHWKRSASSGALVYTERQAEQGKRLAIVFDNGVGELSSANDARRFEHLVSEAATAAHQYLRAGYEVELVTRDEGLDFGTGPVHRRRALERLALVAPVPISRSPLRGSDPRAPELRLSMRDEDEEVA